MTVLDGKVAIVTGSARGIGRATAELLAAQGAKVVINDLDGDVAQQTAGEIEGETLVYAGDLTQPGVPDELVAKVIDAWGRIDILVNNAGIYPATLTPDLTDADLDAMLAVNVRAPHVLVAALAPAMAERGAGAIVTIGSWMARTGTPFAAMYTATKAADEQLTRAWAAEYGPRGVRVNTVAPGATLTPGNEGSRAVLDAMTATTPAGVVVQPQDIAHAVAFLVSEEASMIHGATLAVDGGISATRLS